MLPPSVQECRDDRDHGHDPQHDVVSPAIGANKVLVAQECRPPGKQEKHKCPEHPVPTTLDEHDKGQPDEDEGAAVAYRWLTVRSRTIVASLL